MKKTICLLLCFILLLALLCGCDGEGFSAVASTAPSVTEPVTEPVTTVPATQDTPKKFRRYDMVALKQKAEETYSKFNRIISDTGYKGNVYMKIGNDFEYLSSTGSSDAVGHTGNSLNTCFYAGSVTKQFTAAAVLLLIEEEKLSLDDNLGKFFPKYKAGKDVTVEQLLHMNSGIKNYVVPIEFRSDDFRLVPELDEMIEKDNSFKKNKRAVLDWIFSQELSFEPGKYFDYSDSNYYLLGEIIAKVSEMSYYEFINERFFKPLGMGSSGFTANDHTAECFDGEEQSTKLRCDGVGYSSAGLITNVSDTLKWVDALLGGEVLSEDSLEYMFTSNGYDYGCGVYVKDKVISVTGNCGGYRSALKYRADRSEIYLAYSNYSYCDPTYLHWMFKKTLSRFER